MARLLTQPNVGITEQEAESGPETVGATSSSSIANFTQTVSSPYGAWMWKFTFVAHRGEAARELRGWAVALHGGANATRWNFVDPDRATASELGLSGTPSFSNGMKFSNGRGFSQAPNAIPLASASAKDATTVTLSDYLFGHDLPFGSYISFFPSHFGLYVVTQELGNGQYRIWPPLRKAVAAGDYVTLFPTLAMRPKSKDAIKITRELNVVTGATAEMVEVFDYDIRSYFTD